MGSAYAQDVVENKSISTDNSNRQDFTDDDLSLTITDSATLTRTGQFAIDIKTFNNATVTVDLWLHCNVNVT